MSKKSSIVLFNDRILVRPAKLDEKTEGGIVLPTTSKPKHYRSVVAEVGDGFPATQYGPARPLKVAKGDTVIHAHPGNDFDLNGETLKLLTENDLVGKLPA